MADLPPSALNLLINIHIGQNIRNEGILQSDVRDKDQASLLLLKNYIRESQWYRHSLFRTTQEGSRIAEELLKRRIEEKGPQLKSDLGEIPQKVIGFFVRRFISKNLAFQRSKPIYSLLWEDSILNDSRIWIFWEEFFKTLESHGFCVQAYSYVATRGGETRDIQYVISSETREFLTNFFLKTDFTPTEENAIRLHQVMKSFGRILFGNDLNALRQQYYNTISETQVSEEQLSGIVDAMKDHGITSEYRGLLSEKKPFEIYDIYRFEIFLKKELLEPVVSSLLQEKGEIQTFTTGKKIPSIEEESGKFYLMLSLFEHQLRSFIKEMLGDNWSKKIRNDLPKVMDRWEKGKIREEKLGVEPEKEPINYAGLKDYLEIIKTYEVFTDGEDLARIGVKLEDWYRYGRNPVMHCRTFDSKKIEATKVAVNYLEAWMSRKRQNKI